MQTLTMVPDISQSPPDRLDRRLEQALGGGDRSLHRLRDAEPVDAMDAAMTLLRIHDLHIGPIGPLGGMERWQHHPTVSALKGRLETDYIAMVGALDKGQRWVLPDDPVAAVRTMAAMDRVPEVYDWLAHQSTNSELLEFVALEGGPDGGFDDLVAICQVGLAGEAKLELARNYWDEMGRGGAPRVHTGLHHQMANALDLPVISRRSQPLEALHRSTLGSLMASNRWLQPEMLGALGLIELQAGPRCRMVVAALERLGAPAAALPFYEEHATVDPGHGKSWLSHVVAPLAAADPIFGARMVRGARWRSVVNARFLDAISRRFGLVDRHSGPIDPSAANAR